MLRIIDGAVEPRRYDLILFDVDDTLLDFKASEKHALEVCWKRYFNESIVFEIYVDVFRSINRQIWREVGKGQLKPPQVSCERARRCLRYFGLRSKNAEALGKLFALGLSQVSLWLPGAEAGFRSIAGRYDVGLITNGLTNVQYPRIDRIGIRDTLKTIQVSEEVGTMKPKSEIFELALLQAGHSKERSLMVGDSVTSDLQGAVNVGIDFCWIKSDPRPLPLGVSTPRFRFESIPELDAVLA